MFLLTTLFFFINNILANFIVDNNSFYNYINSGESEKSYISMEREINLYLEDNLDYKKLKYQLDNFHYKNMPFGIFPSISFQFNRYLGLKWSLGSIWKNIYSTMYSREKKKILFEIYIYKQNSGIEVEEKIEELVKIISSIRRETKKYFFLEKTLKFIEKKKSDLDENRLNEIFTLREMINEKRTEIYDLNNQLELLISSNRIFFKNKIKTVNNIFKIIETKSLEYLKIKSYKINNRMLKNSSYVLEIIKKIPETIGLELDSNYSFHISYGLQVGEIMRKVLSIYYENAINSIENNYRNQKLKIFIEKHKRNMVFYREKIKILNKNLDYLYSLLENEEKIKLIKPKRLWETKLEVIEKQEEILSMEVLLKIQNLIII